MEPSAIVSEKRADPVVSYRMIWNVCEFLPIDLGPVLCEFHMCCHIYRQPETKLSSKSLERLMQCDNHRHWNLFQTVLTLRNDTDASANVLSKIRDSLSDMVTSPFRCLDYQSPLRI